MSEDQKQTFFAEWEIDELFDKGFLPTLQRISKRINEASEEELVGFNVSLSLVFTDLDKPLSYQSIKDKVRLQIIPLVNREEGEEDECDESDEPCESGQ